MVVREILPGISSVGVIDWHRLAFDDLMELPDGTSYNAYVVQGSEKTALIDTVEAGFDEEYVTNLIRAKLDSVDYIIANHAEQDHSGALPLLLELYPMATVVTTEKGKDLLCSMLLIDDERILVAEDRDSLDLGDKTLVFYSMPWVHWPETMVTWVPEDRILFSCDLFGAHLACSSLFADGSSRLQEAAKRYYAVIMQPFRSKIQEYVEQVESLNPAVIAPSHGPVYNNPSAILSLYREWSSDEGKNLVVIPFVSMHHSTKWMVERLTDALIQRGIDVRPYDLGTSSTGTIAMDLIDATTIVIGSPTVHFGPHPKAANIAFLTNILKPKARYAAVIGSFGWGGKTVQTLGEMMPKLEAEMLEPVYIKGKPGEQELVAITVLADEIYKRHQDNHLV
ncbi:FprA family A-type flavoprotein [Methanogenium organophilum]|uniref:FprA family A-type flavoprotein n=1 Tax=Methanogenium organophilum TaxID=2199 RepID=A0A9X9T8W6_METOG|nr:FprA family A-type flavoprotein [Methanogenium organophilum]WAI02080.1 FprA family A-type flavoprotein [Methanogenium organophilum]